MLKVLTTSLVKKPMVSLDIDSLRDHIAYVPQDNFLFSDSIEHNINFGHIPHMAIAKSILNMSVKLLVIQH